MDPLANLLNLDEPDADSELVKEKKKRKSSATTSKKLLAKAAEENRQQLIKQKQEFLKETKARVQAEWERNHEKAPIFQREFHERLALLEKSVLRLADVDEIWEDYIGHLRSYQKWRQYIKCDGLPDPSSFSEVNTYIFAWTELDTNCNMNYCIKKTEEVMELLSGLEEVINDPGPDRPPNFLKDIKELRRRIRKLLQDHIDKATFYLFSKIETDMVFINVTTSRYSASCPYFQMSLWAELITPIPSKGKEIRKPLKIMFEEVQVMVVLPVILLDIHKVMRVMWMNYDHWSDQCRTYDCPPMPSYHSLNMYDLFISEFDLKVEIMDFREHQEAALKLRLAHIPAEPTLSQEIMAWTSEPQRALSEEIMFKEYEEEDKLGEVVKEILNEFEINLRERSFLGNVLLLEVLHQPPQAQCLRLKHCVTLRKRPPQLQMVNYYIKFPPPEEHTDEEKEEEEEEEEEKVEKPPPPPKIDPEVVRGNLLVVKLQPDQSVLWFETPRVANWDPVHEYWSNEDIHDVEYDEEEEAITFRTGRLGLLGLHVSRYCNFPYEDWLFEVCEDGGVKFYLKTSKTELLFKIREGKVCLEKMANAPSNAMNWILGKYYPPSELLKNMKKGGLDVFPGLDANTYLEDVDSKHVVIERNIYQVWGLFSKSFRFKRSKFNQMAGRDKIVFQAQEIYKDHQVDFCLIQTSMCSCYVLDISEESEKYSSEGVPEMEECVDLYSLLCKNSTGNAKRLSDTTCILLVQTIKDFLSCVRPISFS